MRAAHNTQSMEGSPGGLGAQKRGEQGDEIIPERISIPVADYTQENLLTLTPSSLSRRATLDRSWAITSILAMTVSILTAFKLMYFQ